MAVGTLGGQSPAWGALQIAFHDQEGLVHLLDGARLLAYGGGYRGKSHGSATELVDDGAQDAVVHLVQAVRVNVQGLERVLCDADLNGAIALDLGEVAHTAQQRMSAGLLCALPIVVAIGFWIVKPDFIQILYTDETGKIFLTYGIISEIIGILVIRKIANPKF